MESTSVSKKKITNKKDLEVGLDWIILDCWLDFPYDENLTREENNRRYDEYVYKRKMEILAANYDICLDEEEEALNNSEHN